MKLRMTSIILAAAVLPSVGFAQKQRQQTKQSYSLPPYGMAGCGLGSLIFSGDNTGMNIKNNSMGPQLLAATTNNYIFPQSSAITTGSSNCTDVPAGSADAFRIERETYVTMNLNDLNKEAAQGQGDKLRGLSEMLGCAEQNEVQTFAKVAQFGHSSIFSDAQPVNVTNRWVSLAETDQTLQQCLNARVQD
ncbi:MAG: hypothetical protein RJB13_541 [Pseudomonadota bacterium]